MATATVSQLEQLAKAKAVLVGVTVLPAALTTEKAMRKTLVLLRVLTATAELDGDPAPAGDEAVGDDGAAVAEVVGADVLGADAAVSAHAGAAHAATITTTVTTIEPSRDRLIRELRFVEVRADARGRSNLGPVPDPDPPGLRTGRYPGEPKAPTRVDPVHPTSS